MTPRKYYNPDFVKSTEIYLEKPMNINDTVELDELNMLNLLILKSNMIIDSLTGYKG